MSETDLADEILDEFKSGLFEDDEISKRVATLLSERTTGSDFGADEDLLNEVTVIDEE